MTSEEKDAILGRTLREKKALTEHLAYLRAEAQQVSGQLGLLASFLSGNIQLIRFTDATSTTEYIPAVHAPGPEFKVAEIDGNNIAALLRQYQDTAAKLERVNATAKDLGF
ncbi:MAG: hypothetical protein WBE38_02755 [Terracidiphilus sp.]